jgi:hypothetical protein
VADGAAHRHLVCDPDGYRPDVCPRCAHGRLHAHDFRARLLRQEEGDGAAVLVIRRYRCIGCGAVWRILPRFVARLLWRSWRVIETRTIGPPPSAAAPTVPARTVQRWRSRLAAAALLLGEVMREGGSELLGVAAAAFKPAMTRLEAVTAYAAALAVVPGGRLAGLAATVHRLSPGVRLM